jgi:hypothetical protein
MRPTEEERKRAPTVELKADRFPGLFNWTGTFTFNALFSQFPLMVWPVPLRMAKGWLFPDPGA